MALKLGEGYESPGARNCQQLQQIEPLQASALGSRRHELPRKRRFWQLRPGGCAIWARVARVGGFSRVSEWGGIRAERWNVLVDPFGKLRAGYGAPPGAAAGMRHCVRRFRI